MLAGMMADQDFTGKTIMVVGQGDLAHRTLVMSLAQGGASVAIAGLAPELSAEAALHSIANEVWAIGRKACVVTLAALDDATVAEGALRAQGEVGKIDLVVHVDP
jgi:NAD(P)-dependent dehydrogenase (short-subunit alcohol dehydrogenase family)